MRAPLILAAAMMFGLAGGYAWSITGPKPAARKPPVARVMALPPSPEEAPGADDRHWTSRSTEEPPLQPRPPATRARAPSITPAATRSAPRARRRSTRATPATAARWTATATASPASRSALASAFAPSRLRVNPSPVVLSLANDCLFPARPCISNWGQQLFLSAVHERGTGRRVVGRPHSRGGTDAMISQLQVASMTGSPPQASVSRNG